MRVFKRRISPGGFMRDVIIGDLLGEMVQLSIVVMTASVPMMLLGNDWIAWLHDDTSIHARVQIETAE